MNKVLSEVFLFKESNKINRYMALWDTGATETLISKKVVSDLNLDVAGTVELSTINGSLSVNRYNVRLLLNGYNQAINIIPAEFTHRKECDIIIGMDIISLGLFTLDKGEFTFSISN